MRSDTSDGNDSLQWEFQKSLWLERAESCRFNAAVVGKLLSGASTSATQPLAASQTANLKEVAQIWSLLGVAIDIFMVSKDSKSGMATEPVGPGGRRISGLINSWVNSAMGRPLLSRLVRYLKSKTTAVGFQLQKQVLVTAMCIFGQQQLDSMLSYDLSYANPTSKVSVDKCMYLTNHQEISALFT